MFGSRIRFVAAIGLSLVLALAVPATASALTLREGNVITIAEDEVVDDDLYAFGTTITIDGIVEGDVVAFGQFVLITGDVRGSVISGAQTVRIDGNVGGSVRAGAAIVDVTGQVDGDVLAGASSVNVGGDVGRDLAAGANDVNVTGTVDRNIMTGSQSLTISGAVGGNVEAQTADVTVEPGGTVGGDLDYWSTQEADVQGEVSGEASRHEPETRRETTRRDAGPVGHVVGAILAWVQSFVGFVLLGLFLVLLVREPMRAGVRTVHDRTLLSLGIGALVFFVTPAAAGFLFLAGLFLGVWWLAFVLMAAYWLLLLVGLIVGALALGSAILRRASSSEEPSAVWSFLLGLVLVWLVAIVPFLGWLVGWAVMLVGTGAVALRWLGHGEQPVVVAPQPAEPSAAQIPQI